MEELGYCHIYLHLPFRQRGLIKSHLSSKTKTPTYSAIWKRVNKLDIKTNPRLGKDIIAIDGTGVKVADRVRVDEAEMAKEKLGIFEDSCGNGCKIKADYRLGNHR